MRMATATATRRTVLVRKACAAAMTLVVGLAGPAMAQTIFYEWTGEVFPVPADATNPTFSLAEPLRVGNGAPGSFSALAGAALTADQLLRNR